MTLFDFMEKKENRLLRFVIRMWVSNDKGTLLSFEKEVLGYISADILWMMWLRVGAEMSRR